ncbi:linear amide C-N hydrolase [Orbus mooreae]|uniref:linear amide C-N hydrolase n=1 Tax=Orbus mooreae TaxID=3074107 RepID=UPI00370DA818
MRLSKLVSLGLMIMLPVSFTALACSSLAISDKNNNVYHGRTLELSDDLPSWITYYPKSTFFQKLSPNGSNAISYSSKYAILAITTDVYNDGDQHNMFQGLNDQGLSFSANMISNFNLAPIAVSDYEHSIPYTSLGEWALSNFSTTKQVAEAMKSAKFWAPVLDAFGGIQSPFHFVFYDKTGNSIVIEASNGQLKVYDNPTKVMTNGPSFPWHLENLNNYTQLNNVDHSTSVFGNIRVTQPDSGIAVAALPSSDTSVGRFIRAVYYTSYAPKVNNPSDAMNVLAHIMNRFDRLKDITVDDSINESSEKTTIQSSEYTVWTSLSDLSGGNIMVRGYNDINYSQYSLEQYKNSQSAVFVQINTNKL